MSATLGVARIIAARYSAAASGRTRSNHSSCRGRMTMDPIYRPRRLGRVGISIICRQCDAHGARFRRMEVRVGDTGGRLAGQARDVVVVDVARLAVKEVE